jgi:hypothetical protein
VSGSHSLDDYRTPWAQVFKSGVVGVLLVTSCVVARAGTLNDYNPHDVDIPDDGSSVNSDLSLRHLRGEIGRAAKKEDTKNSARVPDSRQSAALEVACGHVLTSHADGVTPDGPKGRDCC